MGYSVECTLEYNPDDPSTHSVKQTIFRFGEVNYAPRPEDGRRIVEFPEKEMQEEAIRKGQAGLFVIPPDVVSAEMDDTIRRIVTDQLQAHGLISRPAPARGRDAEEEDEEEAGEVPATSQAIGLAREHDIDLSDVPTGDDGKIGKGDVQAYIDRQASTA